MLDQRDDLARQLADQHGALDGHGLRTVPGLASLVVLVLVVALIGWTIRRRRTRARAVRSR